MTITTVRKVAYPLNQGEILPKLVVQCLAFPASRGNQTGNEAFHVEITDRSGKLAA